MNRADSSSNPAHATHGESCPGQKHFGLLMAVVMLAVYGPARAEKASSIPYPSRSVYVEKGMTGSLGFAIYDASGPDYMETRFLQWEGHGAFYYKPFLSAGAHATIISGPPNDSSEQIENRYQMFTRLHKRMGNLAVYVGPGLGLHFLNYVADLSVENQEDSLPNTVNQTRLELIFESGAGYRMTRLLGLTASGKASHSWATESRLAGTVGMSFDISTFWQRSTRLTQGFFLQVEWQYAKIWDLSFPKRDREWTLGLGAGVSF